MSAHLNTSQPQQQHKCSAPLSALSTAQSRSVPVYKQLLLGTLFLAAFIFLDGSSSASKEWEGAPPWYLPVGLTLALLLSEEPS
jgi:hypothetical protein